MDRIERKDSPKHRLSRSGWPKLRVQKREWRQRARSAPRHYWINHRFLEQVGKGGKVPLGFLSPDAGQAEIEAFVREIWELHLEWERRQQAGNKKKH